MIKNLDPDPIKDWHFAPLFIGLLILCAWMKCNSYRASTPEENSQSEGINYE